MLILPRKLANCIQSYSFYESETSKEMRPGSFCILKEMEEEKFDSFAN